MILMWVLGIPENHIYFYNVLIRTDFGHFQKFWNLEISAYSHTVPKMSNFRHGLISTNTSPKLYQSLGTATVAAARPQNRGGVPTATRQDINTVIGTGNTIHLN